nr:retrovirus-related Pol polyprotein from transposon TNT 1-94 [Tanacetum cinerariifolium]
AKKESSDDESLTFRSEVEEYAMAVRDFKKFFKRRGRFVRQPRNDKKTSKEAEMTRTSKMIENVLDASDSDEEDDEKAKDETCLVAQASNKIRLRVDLEPDEWIKDSGCSKHMTGNRKLFSSYKAYNGGNVIFGSNLHGNVTGKGQIRDNKFRVTFSEHDSEITKDGKVIGRGIRKKGLYVMKLGNKPEDKICLVTIDENSTLWHRRLGHANIHLIQSLASKELVRNLPKLNLDQHLCDACKIRKQAHASHKAKNIVSTTRCLELIHMDLFGLSAVRSYEGNRYTLVIVDDYSRYTWTRFLKDKIKAFNQFEIFSKKIQNQLGCTIVSIRTDHIRDIDNEVQFGEFCNANGITHNFSAPRTPQSSGVEIKESLNVTFDETPPPFKTSPMVDDDLDEEEAIKITKKKILENNSEDETLEIDKIVNIKESRKHPLENVIGTLTKELLVDFKQFQMDVKSEFLDGFINEEVYVAQPLGFNEIKKPDHVYKLKKALYGLKQVPKAWPDIKFSVCLCARFQEAPKTSHLKAIKRIFSYIKGTTHLGLWYPKATSIETVVYADSDHAGDYVDRKRTSAICTFVGCCLTSWFSKK